MIDINTIGGNMQKGDDIVTTFIGGCLFLVLAFVVLVTLAAVIT